MRALAYGHTIRQNMKENQAMATQTKADKTKAAAQDGEAPKIDPRRQAALDTALQQVEKSFGKGSAMRLGDRPEQDVEVIPTGSLALDMALGIGRRSQAPARRCPAARRLVNPYRRRDCAHTPGRARARRR